MSADAVSILCQIFLAFGIALAGGALSATFARTHKQLCAFISLGARILQRWFWRDAGLILYFHISV